MSRMAPDTTLFDIGQLISAPIVAQINVKASTHPAKPWRISIGSTYFLLIPLSTVSISFNYLPKAEHRFEVESVSYKKLSSPRDRPLLIISLITGCLTMVPAAAAVQFYWPVTFSSAGLSVHITTGDLNHPNQSQPSIHVSPQIFWEKLLAMNCSHNKTGFQCKNLELLFKAS